MINKKITGANVFAAMINDWRESFIAKVEDKNNIEAENCLKEMANYELKDARYLNNLDAENYLFFAAFNPFLEYYVDAWDIAFDKIFANEGKDISVFTLSALIANSNLFEEIEPEDIYELFKLLSNKIRSSCCYNYELQNLKKIKEKLFGYVRECLEYVGELYTVDDLCEAYEMSREIDKLISISALNKAKFLGWSIVK